MKSTLRFKFFCIVLIIAIPFIFHALLHYVNTVEENKQTAVHNNLLRAVEIANKINDFIETSQNILYSLALHPAIVRNDAKSCNNIFSRLLPLYPYNLNIISADMSGRIIGSALPPDKSHGLNYSDTAWFKNGRVGISTVNNVQTSKSFTEPFFMVTMPVFDSRGAQTAVLGFPTNLIAFQDHLTSTETFAANTALTVIDNNGNILLDTMNKSNIGKLFKNASIISELNKVRSTGDISNIDSAGVQRFYSYATIEMTGWKVLLGIPVKDVYTAANRAALTHLIIFAIICIVGMLFSLFYSRRILSKVELLINGFHQISSGNLNYSLPIIGNDEFAYAGQAFNKMISDRKLAEEEIKHLAASLEKRVEERTAQLLNAKNELETFSYTVSHDLQAPTRHVLAFSEILIKEHSQDLSPESLHHLQRISKAGENMRDMITHLLALSNLNRKELALTDTDLSTIFKSILIELQDSEPERIVSVSIEDHLHTLADPVLLEIALRNLLQNAWNYTRKVSSPCIEIGQTMHEGKNCFYIKDNGCGFDMFYAYKLFVPFQRLHIDKDYEGTGVGLATVYRIIQRHGGFITAVSAPGEGAVFYFNTSQGVCPLEQETL